MTLTIGKRYAAAIGAPNFYYCTDLPFSPKFPEGYPVPSGDVTLHNPVQNTVTNTPPVTLVQGYSFSASLILELV